MSDKPIKAYEVRESQEGHSVVVFATNGAAARREGAGELNVEFGDVESCTRAPWADQYAPGPVPLTAMLEAGWWHECSHCGVTFDCDGRRDEDDEREDEFEPVAMDGKNFCSPTCSMRHFAEVVERKNREIATIEAAQTRWPTATNISAGLYGKTWPSRDYEWQARFSLPGLKYPVNWTLGESDVMVSRCDADVFRERYGVKP